MIDAHQHFWTITRTDYGWLTPEKETLYRDHLPADLAPLHDAAGIERSVLVQAAPTVAESTFLLEIARETSFVAGVVGWVRLDQGDVGDHLDALQSAGPLVGVRPMIQDLPDDTWMLDASVARGLAEVQRRGLAFDALVFPRHLRHLRVLLDRNPDLRVVIDHGAKPDIAAGAFDDWAEAMTTIASETHAHCKLSGLVTEAGNDPSEEKIRPYTAHLLECFGAGRLMWGSDWPVVELAGGFAGWWEMTQQLLGERNDAERAAILGESAASFYRL